MKTVTYKKTDSELYPAIVSINGRSTPVWRQGRYTEEEFAYYIRNNGCGHCCSAMALRLNGVDDITPYTEYLKCREIFGAPIEEGEHAQGHFMSIGGVEKIIKHYGVKAQKYGVKDKKQAKENIEKALKDGKQVIFWSHPSADFPENPFSTGEHYVMAVGYDKDGKVVVANSSEKRCEQGYHLLDIDVVIKALFDGSEPADRTWGVHGENAENAGYVIVG